MNGKTQKPLNVKISELSGSLIYVYELGWVKMEHAQFIGLQLNYFYLVQEVISFSLKMFFLSGKINTGKKAIVQGVLFKRICKLTPVSLRVLTANSDFHSSQLKLVGIYK